MNRISLFLIASALASPVGAQTIAAYDAGTAGSPATAPDPATQGWTLTDPSGGQVIVSDVSPDGTTGLNAWRLDDQVVFVGGRAHYAALFLPDDVANATANGWDMTTTLRLDTTNGVDIFLEFASGQTAGDDRYLLFFEVNGTNDVLVSDLSGNSFLCVGGYDGGYHTYQLVRQPGMLDAEFFFDGGSLGPFPRSNSNGNAPNGGVHWGSGSSTATAAANFHTVEFSVMSSSFGTSFCSSAPNSTGMASVIEATGSPSVGANGFGLSAGPMATGEPGIFYYGPNEISVPFGNGTRCVGGTVFRVFPPIQADAAGIMATTIDNTSPAHANQIGIASSTWKFQAWFRDPLGGGAGFDLSDGVSVTLTP